MNKREALKLQKGDKFRRKPDAVWNREGMFPKIYTVDRVEVDIHFNHSMDTVKVISTDGKEFTHKEICLP